MFRLVLCLGFFCFSSLAFATIEHGTYSDAAAAVTACNAFAGGPWCQNGNTVNGIGNKQICAAFDGYPYDCHAFRFYVSGGCGDGLEPDAEGLCVDPDALCSDDGLAGSVWDSSSESCGCPVGQVDYLSSTGSYSCVDDLEECSPSHPGFLGFVNNLPVCTYDGDCAEGETGGVVNGDWMCVSEPDCSGTWINGSCISPDDASDTPENSPIDTDGDGIPDSKDSDIDGDGIANGSDDDIDGDGVLNVDDQSNVKDSTASGGGSCKSAPVCSGDAVQCAILQQQWLSRCAKDQKYSEASCDVQPVCSGDVLLCQGLINDWARTCATNSAPDDAADTFAQNGFKTADDYAAEGGVFGLGEEEDLAAVTSSVLSSRSTIEGSCPAPKTVNAAPFGQFEVEFTPFCDLAGMIYWVVMLSAYLTGTFIVFRSVTN